MKYAARIGLGIVVGFVILALRWLAIHKGLGWYDDSEEAFMQAKVEAHLKDPAVVFYFWQPW